MSYELDGKICRYYNTTGGCWNGDDCRFLHVADIKPPCKFFMYSSTGCRYGENCHFSHDLKLLKGLDYTNDGLDYTNDGQGDQPKELKETVTELSGTNNNNMDPTTKTRNETEITAYGDYELQCKTCKQSVKRPPGSERESIFNVLKTHYQESFMEKEGEHIKAVKTRTALEPNQLYWCKTCILVFEKPWSLFQHVADKARTTKVQRWDRKLHADWLDTVSGLMAGFDLNLYTSGKLRYDLRNLFTDVSGLPMNTSNNNSGIYPQGGPGYPNWPVEEDMDAAALAASSAVTLIQLMANGMMGTGSMGNPYRSQQREMMRKIDQMNRQMHRRTGGGNMQTSLITANMRRNMTKPSRSEGGMGALSGAMAGMDLNCGFSDSEVEELAMQNIKPWDEEASAALAVLRGEMDYLLD